MVDPSRIASDIDLPQLQRQLRFHESLAGGVTAISAEDDDGLYTKAVHSWEPRVPRRSLRVIEDPDGNISAPDGTKPVCRGTAWINNVKTQVALFRVASDSDAVGGNEKAEPRVDAGLDGITGPEVDTA